MNLQPYQQASQKIRKQAELPYEIVKGAAGLVGTGKIASKILPFLNQFIPNDLRQKALTKIDPRLGSFYQQAEDYGFDQNQILDFMKNKFTEEKKTSEPSEHPLIAQAKDFETNYPDIIKALMGYINQGQTPQAAAAIIKQSSPFNQKIKKIEKDTGKNFVDFILELMGGDQQGQAQLQPQQQAQSMQARQEIQPTAQQGPSADIQALMQALEKFNQLRK